MPSETEWLSKLKAGDAVIVVHSGGWSYSHREKKTVEKTTATQIVVNGNRYRRDGGRRCGDTYRGFIEEPTKERLDEMDRERRESNAKGTIDTLTERHRWRDLDLATLEKIAAFLQKHIPFEKREE